MTRSLRVAAYCRRVYRTVSIVVLRSMSDVLLREWTRARCHGDYAAAKV